MPNYFMLIRKSDPKQEPVKFVEIDDEMCAHFGVPSDPVKYHAGWYDYFGLGIACGNSWESMRARLVEAKEEHGVEICDWLSERFNTEAGYTPRSMMS